MSDSYVVNACIYNFPCKGHDFIYEVKSFYNLSDAQLFGRWYVKEFQNMVLCGGKLRYVEITHWDSTVSKLKTYGLYS